MQVSEWGSSGHGWPALHPLIMEDILLQRSYAPVILLAGAAKQARFGQKLARDATQSKVRSLVCQPIIHGNTASIPSIRNSTDISVAWWQACIPSRSRDGEFASFRVILVAESLKGEVPVMAQRRCFVAKTNMRESSPPPRREKFTKRRAPSFGLQKTRASCAVMFGLSGEQQGALFIP